MTMTIKPKGQRSQADLANLVTDVLAALKKYGFTGEQAREVVAIRVTDDELAKVGSPTTWPRLPVKVCGFRLSVDLDTMTSQDFHGLSIRRAVQSLDEGR